MVTVPVLPPRLSPKGHSGNVRLQEIAKELLEQGPGSPGCVGRLGQSISPCAHPAQSYQHSTPHPSIHPSVHLSIHSPIHPPTHPSPLSLSLLPQSTKEGALCIRSLYQPGVFQVARHLNRCGLLKFTWALTVPAGAVPAVRCVCVSRCCANSTTCAHSSDFATVQVN